MAGDGGSGGDRRHERHLVRLLRALPRPVGRAYGWLRRPEKKWVRRPLSVALIAGGLLGFLPVLGFWMLPVGALLLGEDIPPVRRATLGAVRRVHYWWDRRRRDDRRRQRALGRKPG